MEEENLQSVPARARSGPGRWIGLALVVVAVLGAGYFFFLGGGPKASDLDLLPRNSAMILVVDVDAFQSSPVFKDVRASFPDGWNELEANMEKSFGFGPDAISHIVFGGDPSSARFVALAVMKDDLDEETVGRVADEFRCREKGELEGKTIWRNNSTRSPKAIAWFRSDAMLIGHGSDVEAALRGNSGGGELADTLLSRVGLGSTVAFAFDMTAMRGLEGALDRELRRIVPALMKHMGPIVARADLDDDMSASAELLSSAGKVVMKYSVELDGKFMADIVADIAAGMPKRPRRYDEPPPDVIAPAAEPARSR